MAPRSRSLVYNRPQGTITRFGSTIGGGTVVSGSHSCSDQTGWGDCAPLSITHLTGEGGIINSKYNPGYYGSYAQAYVADILLNFNNFPALSAPPGADKSDVAYATDAVARTNPSRPYVDIPVNILELGDIARLIQRRGYNLIREAGRENLRYQFGIRPLVTDLVKLSNFQDQVARRILELERLAGPRGLRRTIDLGGWSNTGTSNKTNQSNRITWNTTYQVATTQQVKGHVRWLPQRSYLSMSASDRQRLAFRSVLGLTIDGSTLWNALPWSWLIDWCSHVGTWFQANRNIVPALLSGVHIMRETRTEWVCPSTETAQHTFSGIRVQRLTRTRNPSFVAPVAHFPFLSGNQMGILASLAVTRL